MLTRRQSHLVRRFWRAICDSVGPHEVVLPQVVDHMQGAKIIKWHVYPGSQVKADQLLCELETEEIEFELDSNEAAGYVLEILEQEGTGNFLACGTSLCRIVASKEELSSFQDSWRRNHEKTKLDMAVFARAFSQSLTPVSTSMVSARVVSYKDITHQTCLSPAQEVPFENMLPTDIYGIDVQSGDVTSTGNIDESHINPVVRDLHRLVYSKRPDVHVMLSLQTPAAIALSSKTDPSLKASTKQACRFKSISVADDSHVDSILKQIENASVPVICVPGQGFLLLSRTLPRLLNMAQNFEIATRTQLYNPNMEIFSEKKIAELHAGALSFERNFSASRFKRWQNIFRSGTPFD